MIGSSFHRFPRLKKRGPIEASQKKSASFLAILFPRLKKRGPIEAKKYFYFFGLPFLISALEKARPH